MIELNLKKKLSFFALITIGVGCGKNADHTNHHSQLTDHSAPGHYLKSSIDHADLSTVSSEDLFSVKEGNNLFAWDAYKKITARDQNVVYSPLSLVNAVSMTYAGAQSATEAQIAKTFRFSLPQNRLHLALNRLFQEVQHSDTPDHPNRRNAFNLSLNNSIWVLDQFKILPSYLDGLARNYDAGVHLVNFQSDPEDVRNKINQWVSQQTHQKITQLLSSNSINAMTRLVLTNTAYFNARWYHRFNPADLQDFHFLSGKTQQVPMMQIQSKFKYSREADSEWVEIPYDEEHVSFVLIFPNIGKWDSFHDSLTSEKMTQSLAHLAYKKVNLTLPKFKYDFDLPATQILKDMGMVDAFDIQTADFSAIAGQKALFISNVIHKCFISIDEQGTEAAAATAVIVIEPGASMPVPDPELPIKIEVNRPFLFLIKSSDTILFLGSAVNPLAAN